MARKTRFEEGYRQALADATELLQTANVNPPEAKAHWHNAGDALTHALKRGWLLLRARRERRMPEARG